MNMLVIAYNIPQLERFMRANSLSKIDVFRVHRSEDMKGRDKEEILYVLPFPYYDKKVHEIIKEWVGYGGKVKYIDEDEKL